MIQLFKVGLSNFRVRNLLKRALGGEDLTQTHGMEQPHKIREIAR